MEGIRGGPVRADPPRRRPSRCSPRGSGPRRARSAAAPAGCPGRLRRRAAGSPWRIGGNSTGIETEALTASARSPRRCSTSATRPSRSTLMHRNCRGSAWISRPPRWSRSGCRVRRPLISDDGRQRVVPDRVAPDELPVEDLVDLLGVHARWRTAPATMDPMLLPATRSTTIPAAASSCRTPMCAKPRAPPPASTIPTDQPPIRAASIRRSSRGTPSATIVTCHGSSASHQRRRLVLRRAGAHQDEVGAPRRRWCRQRGPRRRRLRRGPRGRPAAGRSPDVGSSAAATSRTRSALPSARSSASGPGSASDSTRRWVRSSASSPAATASTGAPGMHRR